MLFHQTSEHSAVIRQTPETAFLNLLFFPTITLTKTKQNKTKTKKNQCTLCKKLEAVSVIFHPLDFTLIWQNTVKWAAEYSNSRLVFTHPLPKDSNFVLTVICYLKHLKSPRRYCQKHYPDFLELKVTVFCQNIFVDILQNNFTRTQYMSPTSDLSDDKRL